MKEAREFLDLCRRRFPSPRANQRHSLTLEGDTLVLTLMQGDTFQRFNIDDEDLKKPAALLLAELIAVSKTPSKKATPKNPDAPTPA